MTQGISAELIAAKWGLSAPEARRVLRESPREGRRAPPRRAVRQRDRADRRHRGTVDADRRDHPPRHHGRDPGRAEAGVLQRGDRARFPQIDWEITAGNSSPLSDGSAAVLITSGELARELGLRPLARIHTSTVVGADPLYMLTGVIPATEKVLERAGLDPRRHRPVRGERGVRPGGAGLGRTRPAPTSRKTQRQRRRDRDRPSARRQRRADHDDAGQRPRAARRPLRRCRRCARAAAWPTPPSSNGSADRRGLPTSHRRTPRSPTVRW